MNTPTSPIASGGSFTAWRIGFWRRVIAMSDPAVKRRFMGVTVSLVAVIGFIDYLTGFELSMLVFYLLPVSLAVAGIGWRFGVLTAVLSVLSWLASDVLSGAHYTTLVVPCWNALIALGTYLVVIWLVASVISLQREMEERVRQRTAALTDEIAERVRLEKVVLNIAERERTAIGHELHDGLSQHLTGTALVTQAFGSKLASRSPADAADVGKIVALIEHGIEQTRQLARGLLLAEVESHGLVDALDELATTTRERYRVECVFMCETNPALGENGSSTHLFRIAEEATRNSVRHGKANKVELHLSEDSGNLVLEVRDNGIGVPEPSRRGRGLGLRIMAHRAAIIGAAFKIENLPLGGTSVSCRLQPSSSAA